MTIAKKIDLSSLKPWQHDPFVIVIDDLFDKEFCDNLIQMSEEAGDGYVMSMINIGNDRQIVDTTFRNNLRNLVFDKKIADEIFEKIKEYVPKTWNKWKLCGLNERLSFLKYKKGEYFRPHFDGTYVRPGKTEKSVITVQLYLNTVDIENDTENNGSTRFLSQENNSSIDVLPKVGRILLFEHELLHEGVPLEIGYKYCMRTDVMYRRPSLRDTYI